MWICLYYTSVVCHHVLDVNIQWGWEILSKTLNGLTSLYETNTILRVEFDYYIRWSMQLFFQNADRPLKLCLSREKNWKLHFLRWILHTNGIHDTCESIQNDLFFVFIDSSLIWTNLIKLLPKFYKKNARWSEFAWTVKRLYKMNGNVKGKICGSIMRIFRWTWNQAFWLLNCSYECTKILCSLYYMS